MTITYGKTATSFEQLKSDLMTEFKRRNKNGSLADLAYSSSASADNPIGGGYWQ